MADSLTEDVNLPSIKAVHLLARVLINITWQLAHIYIFLPKAVRIHQTPLHDDRPQMDSLIRRLCSFVLIC